MIRIAFQPVFTIAIFASTCILIKAASSTTKTCLSLVKTDNSTTDTDWDQSIHTNFLLKSNQAIQNIELIIEYDHPVYQLYSTFGIFERLTDRSHIMSQVGYRLAKGQAVPVDFYAWYDRGGAHPTIIKITMNGQLVCRNDIPSFGEGEKNDQNAVAEMVQEKKEKVLDTNTANALCNDSGIFVMDENQNLNDGRYSGTLKLHSIENRMIKNPIVEIIFDGKVYIIGTKSYPSSTGDSKKFRIEVLDSISGKKPLLLKFFITYPPLDRPPQIEEVLMDGVTVCRSPSASQTPKLKPTTKMPRKNKSNVNEEEDEEGFTEPPQKTTLPVSLQPDKFHEWLFGTMSTTLSYMDTPDPKLLQPSECHHRKLLSIGYRIVGGNEADRDQFPWHAALYQRKDTDYSYQCGGSLITRKAMITAAHCLAIKNTVTILPIEDMLVYLGLFSLKKEMGGEQVRKVSKVTLHPDYEPVKTYYSDIAVVKFSELVHTTDFVSPVCLFDRDSLETVNRIGLVPGWGFNEVGELSENLTFIEMPIVPRRTCLKKNIDFYSSLLNGRTFCAGEAAGKSVCNGDSGGGLVFSDDGLSWRIRGIVSLSLGKPNTYKCDPNYYTVFTDVNQFLPWIKENVI